MRKFLFIILLLSLNNIAESQSNKIEFYIVDSVACKYIKRAAINIAVRDHLTDLTYKELASIYLWDTIPNCDYCFSPRKSILQPKPILTLNEIEAYEWKTHTIKLTAGGMDSLKRLKNISLNIGIPGFEKLNNSIYGVPFVIVANNEIAYEGWFFPAYSSFCCDRVRSFIDLNFDNIQLLFQKNPCKSFGDDPRDNNLIKNILILEKKLVE